MGNECRGSMLLVRLSQDLAMAANLLRRALLLLTRWFLLVV